MKKIITLLSIFIFTIFLIGCETIKSNNDELQLINFAGICSDDDGFDTETRILEKSFISKDIMQIKVRTRVTCCVDLEGKIKSHGNTINLKYIETGEPCDCLCEGILNYEIKGADKRLYEFQLNGEKIDESVTENN